MDETRSSPRVLALSLVGMVLFLSWQALALRSYLRHDTRPPAWEAAGTIHTDIQKGFIRAEVTSFADFIEAGGETQAKRAGKQRLELKNYVVQDYDLVNFRFNK